MMIDTTKPVLAPGETLAGYLSGPDGRTMKERPILLRQHEVIAVLAGTKTQLRRVIKPQPNSNHGGEPYWFVGGYRAWRHRGITDVLRMGAINELRCPFGMPGDRLWVREAHAFVPEPAYRCSKGVTQKQNPQDHYEACIYRAGFDRASGGIGWRPSIQMPRWASRLTLEVIRVRVERLHDISDADAIAEGLKGITKDGKTIKYGVADADGLPGTDDHGWAWRDWCTSPAKAYQRLWEDIHGAGSWGANPWVWVVEFSVSPNHKGAS